MKTTGVQQKSVNQMHLLILYLSSHHGLLNKVNVYAIFCNGGPFSLAKGHRTGAGSIWKEGMKGEERHGGRRQKSPYM